MRPAPSCLHAVAAIAVVAATAVAIPAAARAQPRPLSFVDGMNLPSVQDPQLSPDGRQLLFVLERPDWKANRRVGHVFRIGVDGRDQVQLTFGERGESNPRWSPDGRRIAFLARRNGDEHNQIYVLETAGGEARRLTAHPTAPGSLSWSRDGTLVFFVAADAKTPEQKEKQTLQDDVYAFEETDFDQRHLWVADLAGKTTQITIGSYSVTDYSLSPDGTKVAMLRAPTPLLEHSRFAEVWVMDANGGNARRLTTNDIPEQDPELSPDNRSVLFTAAANGRFEPYYNDKIFLVPAAGGEARVLGADGPYQVERAEWAADGTAIYATANFGVHNEIVRVDPATGQASPLTSGEHALGAWKSDARNGQHVFTRSTALRPAEVYLLPLAGGQMRRVTDLFADLERTFTLGRTETITWKGQDGQLVEGLLTYPAGYEAGRRYPLVVRTHGGPAASDRFGFAADIQGYAGKGYAVLRPNYRGSTGYGDTFLRDMVGGYFKQAHLDVLAGADAVIAMGVGDADKLIKMGWSAGGHMTNKVITVTDRFKAASSGAGAANWISMYAQSDHREFRTPWFGGTPWQKDAPIDLYWNHSPLKDVAAVKTPTLFLVGREDPRVPLPQSVEMYRGLRSNGVPTRLWVAPREGHGWTELRHALFKLQVELEWFEKWLFGRTYVWEVAPSGGAIGMTTDPH